MRWPRRRYRWWRFRWATRRLRRALRPYFDERRRSFERVRGELESRGWELMRPPEGVAPVQAWGRLPSGEAFYLRCRWDECRLDVRADAEPEDVEVIRHPDWRGSWAADGWGAFDASWAEPDEVLEAMLFLERRYRAERGDR